MPARDDRIHDVDHVQPLQHRPDRRQVTETLVLGTYRRTGLLICEFGHDLIGAAQVLLRDDPRLAIHTRGLHQVVVRLVTAALANDRCHLWVIRPS
jgi:hypothetical protein